MGESHFVAMKLVMLSCLLVIAAYAAPATFVERDSLVPEEILLQNYNSVADLQAQFGQLKAKLADSSQSTPGVKAAIDNMITMVGTINTAIKEAHKADQGVLDSKMTIIKKKVEAAEVDRKSEWSAVAQIRCLLQSYEKKGTIDKQAEASCTAKESHVSSGKLNINYPAVIAKQNPVENKFAKRTVTDAYYDTCNQRTEPVKRTCVPRKVNDTPKCDSNHKLQNFKL